MALLEINRQPSRKDLRVFSVVLTGFGAVVGWLVARRGGSAGVAWSIGLAVSGLGLACLVLPGLARRVFVGWMIAVSPIAWMVSTVILGVTYFGVVWPTGIWRRRKNRDALRLTIDRSAKSYWIEREPSSDPRRYFRQY